MSEFRSIGFEDNNQKVHYLRVPTMPTDDIITPEQGAQIVLLDRIATALEGILGEMKQQYRGSAHR